MNEYDFAEIIGGEVNLGAQTDKKDVIDQQHRSHSVKGGTWWQIFLYARSRLQSNTILMGIGDLAEIMTQCLDAFPESRADYLANKMAAKIRLQEPMRRLKLEMEKPNIFPALLNKSFFNGGEVDYLSVLPSDLPNTLPIDEKHFHVFDQRDVVRLLTEHEEVVCWILDSCALRFTARGKGGKLRLSLKLGHSAWRTRTVSVAPFPHE